MPPRVDLRTLRSWSDVVLNRVLLVCVCLAFADLAAAEEKIFSTVHGAIRGYDPVAYFTKGKPIRGDREFSFEWRGATWYFASAEHLEKFRTRPERYAPAYGGHCAYAMSKGSFAPIDPAAWTIHRGRLYLNFSLEVRELWKQDVEGHIGQAERHWRRLTGSPSATLSPVLVRLFKQRVER